MTLRKVLVCFCFLLLIGSLASNGQDTELWTSAEVRYKVKKDLRLDLSEGLRFNQNIGAFKSNLFEFGTRYRISKTIGIRAAYRYNVGSSDRSNAQRISISVNIKKKLNRITFGLRSKYQYDFERSVNDGSTLTRNKLSARYDPRKSPWSQSVFAEFFNPFSDISNLEQLRLGAAVNYDFNKRTSLGLKYFYGTKERREGRENRNVVALGLDWNLN